MASRLRMADLAPEPGVDLCGPNGGRWLTAISRRLDCLDQNVLDRVEPFIDISQRSDVHEHRVVVHLRILGVPVHR